MVNLWCVIVIIRSVWLILVIGKLFWSLVKCWKLILVRYWERREVAAGSFQSEWASLCARYSIWWLWMIYWLGAIWKMIDSGQCTFNKFLLVMWMLLVRFDVVMGITSSSCIAYTVLTWFDLQYYMRTGTCKFGASCKYHHPKQGGGSVSPVHLNYYGYPLRPVCITYIDT